MRSGSQDFEPYFHYFSSLFGGIGFALTPDQKQLTDGVYETCHFIYAPFS